MRFYDFLRARLRVRIFRRRRSTLSRKYGASLYARAVRDSRDEGLFRECGLADTPDGRLDSLTLHLYLYSKHFSAGSELVLRSLMESFVRDLDSGLRELGTSDLRVGKKVRGVLSRVYGAFSAYDKAQSAEEWRAALARNILHCDKNAMHEYISSFSARLSRRTLREVIGHSRKAKPKISPK